jgi:hypothetical protein
MMKTYCLEEFLGDGWFPIETDGARKWAWSNKNASLNFPAKHDGFSLMLYGCPVASSILTIYYKGTQLQSHLLTSLLKTINIPAGITRCTITLADCWVPKETIGASDDTRELGVCLKAISSLNPYSEICDWFPRFIDVGLTGMCNINPPCVMCVTRNLSDSSHETIF